MNTEQLIIQLKNHDLDSTLGRLYHHEEMPYETDRYITAVETFVKQFGSGEVHLFSAPGRTEVGGNHTDHQHGHVLAASINLDALAVVRPTESDTVEILSEGFPKIILSINDLSLKEEEIGTTTSLIRGILHGMKERNYKIGGFQAYITSDVLVGAGLSSSAAFEAVIGTILSYLYNEGIVSSEEIAIIGQYAENVYFGKPCGLMDQMACSVGGFVHIDFSDITAPKLQQIPFQLEEFGYQLCIVDTKASHVDLTDDYAQIPIEMKEIADYFHKDYLNEISPEAFFQALPVLANTCNQRSVLRAFHFFEENQRVLDESTALCQKDFSTFLNLVKESGSSSFRFLQNVYTTKDVICQPMSIALAASEHILKNNGVCRVHGGGFAGTIQAFVKTEVVADYKAYMDAIFGEGACHILNIRNCGGTMLL